MWVSVGRALQADRAVMKGFFCAETTGGGHLDRAAARQLMTVREREFAAVTPAG